MTFAQIIQLIIALPKILAFIQDFAKSINELNEKQKEKRAEEKTDALDKAKTRGEIEKGFHDVFNSGN